MLVMALAMAFVVVSGRFGAVVASEPADAAIATGCANSEVTAPVLAKSCIAES
ncbi:hypothetical protein [Nocardioides sp. MH1]|uniref:hypothetical protein n=1 Tax=Nocardioides sp. MH1 TaxID=3242490 RepID=UPI0035220ACE